MEEIGSREKSLIVNKIVGALIFSVFGAMGFFYSLWRENWNSAIWCILLELCCTLVLVFNKSYLKGELHVRYSASFFRILKYTTMVLAVGSMIAFAAYIAVGIVRKEVFDVKSHFAASPVALMAGFWFLILFFDARKYQIVLE